ncbi:MAG: hypothetical protein ACR2Q3_16745 [Woeseiaceae bacterium]
MRLFSTLIVSLGIVGVANAHTLDGEHDWVEQLIHQFFGAHHFALTALLVATGLVILRIGYRRANRRDS